MTSIFGIGCCLTVGFLRICGSGVQHSVSTIPRVVDDTETEVHVQEFCEACYMVPHPVLLPGPSWSDEISKAYRRYEESRRKDLKVPDQGGHDRLLFPACTQRDGYCERS
jgi:hypothetical protein